MSGVVEAGLVLGIISSIISVIDATKQIYDAIKDDAGLPANLKKSASKLPLILKLLKDAERYADNAADESIRPAFRPPLQDCKVQALQLQELFQKVMPGEDDSKWDRSVKAVQTIRKGGRVESLVGGILEHLLLLSMTFPEVMNSRRKTELAKAIEEVAALEPSLPEDAFQQTSGFTHYGSGSQNVSTGASTQFNSNNNIDGNYYNGINHISTQKS